VVFSATAILRSSPAHHTSGSRSHHTKRLFNDVPFPSYRTTSLKLVKKKGMPIGMSWTAYGSHWGNNTHGTASQICSRLFTYRRCQNCFTFFLLTLKVCREQCGMLFTPEVLNDRSVVRETCAKKARLQNRGMDLVCAKSISFGLFAMSLRRATANDGSSQCHLSPTAASTRFRADYLFKIESKFR
jgi:hypothetical protein